MLKVVGVELASIGRIAPEPDDEVIVHEAKGSYRKLLVADDRIVGAILLGPGNDVASIRAAITQRRDVSGQLGALRRSEWNAQELAGV